jgi:hypothetical protein
MNCVGCGKELPKKFYDIQFCGICQITGSRQMPVVGLEYATRGRVDKVNPYKDTMRAIEYIAKHEPKWTRADIERWKKQAALLPDRSTKIADGEWDHSAPSPSGAILKQEQEDAGRVRELWNKAVYEREVLRKKPVNEIQASNYAMVDRWHGRSE